MLYQRCPHCGWGCLRCASRTPVPHVTCACMTALWVSDCQVLHPEQATAVAEGCDGYVDLAVTVNAALSLNSRPCVSAFPCARQPIDTHR